MNNNNSGAKQSGFRQVPTLMIGGDDGREFGRSSSAPLFDFRSVRRLLRRHRFFIAIVCAICVAATVVLDRLTPTVYSASTRILLDEQVINPFGRDEIFSDLSLSNPAVESQMQVMRSPYLLSRAVDRLELGENEEFMAPATTDLAQGIRRLRDRVFPMFAEEPPETTPAERFQMAVERLGDNLRVTRNAQTLVIRLQYTASSPELAAEIVNAVAQTYIDNRLGVRQETAQRAAEWFDERMAELNVRALEVEQRMERMSGGGGDALDASETAASLQRARQELQNALAERARAQTDVLRLRALVESGRGLRGVPSSLESDALQTLIEEADAVRAELALALQASPTDRAQVESLTDRVESLEAAGAAVMNGLLQNAEARATEAETNVQTAQAIFDEARDSSGGSVTNAIDVELRSLEGEARIYRELNERYLQSYLEVVQQQSFPSTEATIIETALPPEYPDGASLRELGLLAFLVGISLGAGGAFLRESMDGSIRTTSQLAKSARAPVLGLLPAATSDEDEDQENSAQRRLPAISVPNRRINYSHEVIALPENRVSLTKTAPQIYATISSPLSAYSEAIRRVNVEAENMRSLMAGDKALYPKCIGFISDRPSQGRSVAAANYAEMLAVGGGRTLLIDMDWTGLYLTECISPAAHFGLAELTAATSSIESNEAFWYDERTSLYFMPNRSMDKEATVDPGVFDQAKLKSLLHALTDKFDNVVLDISPLAHSSDAAGFSDVVLGYVAIADWGVTRSDSLAKELRRAAIFPPKLLGTLMNGVSQQELDEYETAV
ncbi:exopolysaccharide transport family protein [Maritalea mobilis]|uniref:exopolysaccharide transport family protein n=1 Tax=Maritalea mobilis TaxID=483324 RepID=UPI0035A84F96